MKVYKFLPPYTPGKKKKKNEIFLGLNPNGEYPIFQMQRYELFFN